MAFAHHHGVGLPGGPPAAIMAPSGGPLKNGWFAGKSRRVRGSVLIRVPRGSERTLLLADTRLKLGNGGTDESPRMS
jgi:hypothetical protein